MNAEEYESLRQNYDHYVAVCKNIKPVSFGAFQFVEIYIKSKLERERVENETM